MNVQDPLWNNPSAVHLKITNGFNILKTVFTSLLLLTPDSRPPENNALHRAETAFHTLQKWYNASTGLYSTTGWWNSANILTTLCDLAILDEAIAPEIELVIAHSFTQAPRWSPLLYSSSGGSESYLKTITNPQSGIMLVETSWTPRSKPHDQEIPSSNSRIGEIREITAGGGFLNDYYDDEGWWALAWIRAYDLTSNEAYLSTAVAIFEDMRACPPTPCGGGIWWDRSQTYVNAIANELYLSVAAHLANRVGGERRMKREKMKQKEEKQQKEKGQEYLTLALAQWRWFLASGMINPQGTINDGLRIIIREGNSSHSCESNHGTVWSYNQGVILSALVELYRATSDAGHLHTALDITRAAIRKLASSGDKGDGHGVLHDPCEKSGCGADGVQFKGVFMRGLMALLEALEDEDGDDGEDLKAFVRLNAESIWTRDRNGHGEMGVIWDGPIREVNAGSHGSALDAFVAAAASVHWKERV